MNGSLKMFFVNFKDVLQEFNYLIRIIRNRECKLEGNYDGAI